MIRRVIFAVMAATLLIAQAVPATDWVVTKVVSGESFISIEDVIRIKGIDAPPAEESRQHLEELIARSPVSVLSGEDYDQQGRWWVYLSGPDGRDVGSQMISDGYALADRTQSYDKKDEYINLEIEAKRARRGLWANPNGWTFSNEILQNDPTTIAPPLGDADQQSPVTTDPFFVVYPGDFLYHLPGCPLLPDQPISISYLKDLQEDVQRQPVGFSVVEGFEACTHCGAPVLDTARVDMDEMHHLWEQKYLPALDQ